ncbi:unnamed protein product [Oikopleura dioica]|uniref:Carboxylesterase type B domain-containing protein n=1 Tax=Oikopleura dioica TaxID=34765 RepID=E4YJY4_OIKDI|nr:unnamed protein product [Oikopleura dioica]
MKLQAVLLSSTISAESCSERCDGGLTAAKEPCNVESCSIYTDGSNLFGESGTFDTLENWHCINGCTAEQVQPGYYSENAALVTGRGQFSAFAQEINGNLFENREYQGRIFIKPKAGNNPGLARVNVRNRKKEDNSSTYTVLKDWVQVPTDSEWIALDFIWNPAEKNDEPLDAYAFGVYIMYTGENGEYEDFYQDESFLIPTGDDPTTTTPLETTTSASNENTFSFTITSGETTFTGEHTSFGNVHFKGIKFAEAERWRAPVMKTSYDASYDATKYGIMCMTSEWHSWRPNVNDMAEDCLFINVHTRPEYITNGEKRPILAYIHGGGLKAGNNRKEYDYLIQEQGVVMFSIQYRLGPYGFLYDHDSPFEHKGNWGFLDQQMALQWIQQFGGEFGGDVNRVTLGGCSAGSQSTWWHLAMPSSWPYFHAAISNGIGVFGQHNETASLDVNRMYNEHIATQLECPDVDCLRTKSLDELNNQFRKIGSIYIVEVFHDVGFGPHVDGVLTNKTPLEALFDGQIRPNTPISWNYNRDDVWTLLKEGRFINTLSMFAEFHDRIDEITELMTTSGIEYASDLTDQMFVATYGQEYWDKYLVDVFGCPSGADGTIVDCKWAMNSYLNARMWSCNTQYGFTGAPLTDPNIGPIYPLELHKENCDGQTRACHCQDASWVFGQAWMSDSLSDTEKIYLRAGRDFWGQFIREGTFPTGDDFGEMKSIKELDGKINLVDENGIVHDFAYEQECNALNSLGQEIGYLRVYQNGYYHTFDNDKYERFL